MAALAIIVPLFNSATTVAATIRSVQASTYADWQMIVVNDGSTDNGPAIVQQLAERDARISMISQENRGLAGARNSGLVQALEGDCQFVHFLDADDWMTQRGYEWLVAAAKQTGAAYGGYELHGPDGQPLGRQSPMTAPYVGLPEQIEFNRAATHAILFKRETIAEYRFDESLKCVEDYDLWLRMATDGVRFKGVERIVCGYRLRPTSMSKNFAEMCRTYQRVLVRNVERADSIGNWSQLDLSSTRIRKVAGSVALMYATMDAITDPLPNKARAVALLERSLRPESFSPAQLAQAACTAVLFGGCAAPEIDGQHERTWLMPLRQFWVRCAEEGWCGFEDIEPATRELAEKVVHPDAIVDGMLHRAERLGHAAEQGLVVVGVDRAGRRICRRAIARGWRVLAIDDVGDRAESELLEQAGGLTIARPTALKNMSGCAEFGAATWLTGEQGPDGEARIAAAARSMGINARQIELWVDHKRELGQANIALMRRALTQQTAALAG